MTSGEQQPSEWVRLAVNGTLMRGLALNRNLLAVGGRFLRETTTEPAYRMWSIDDRYPAMLRVSTGGSALALEIWSLPAGGLVTVLQQEPEGLTIGKVTLRDGSVVLGVLGEPAACEGKREITSFGGWRNYTAALAADPSSATRSTSG